jgi:hypothetical protein
MNTCGIWEGRHELGTCEWCLWLLLFIARNIYRSAQYVSPSAQRHPIVNSVPTNTGRIAMSAGAQQATLTPSSVSQRLSVCQKACWKSVETDTKDGRGFTRCMRKKKGFCTRVLSLLRLYGRLLQIGEQPPTAPCHFSTSVVMTLCQTYMLVLAEEDAGDSRE